MRPLITFQILLFFSFLLFSNCGGPHHEYSLKPNQRTTDIRQERIRATVVQTARSLIGTRYLRAGKTPDGFDCSGFVAYVLKEIHIPMGASAQEQANQGRSVSIASARPGDLLFFKTKSKVIHVGILTENKPKRLMMIHASSSKGVIEENLFQSDYWMKKMSHTADLQSYFKNQVKTYSSH